jgi:hypothetical protein
MPDQPDAGDYAGLPVAHVISGRSAASPCPSCHTKLDGITGVRFGGFIPPDIDITGEPTICVYCGALLVFADQYGRLRAMSEAERNSVEFAPVVQELLEFFRARARPAGNFTSRSGN